MCPTTEDVRLQPAQFRSRLTAGTRESRDLRVGNDRLVCDGFRQVAKPRPADDADRRLFLDLRHFPDDLAQPHQVVIVAGTESQQHAIKRDEPFVLDLFVSRVVVVLVEESVQLAVRLLATARASVELLHGVAVGEVSVLHARHVCGLRWKWVS